MLKYLLDLIVDYQKADVLERTISDLTKRGIIQVSSSEYRAQLLFVRKKDGSLRLCVDWRGLNNETIKDRTPLAPHSEIRERVQGKQFISCIDIRDAFYNIRLDKDDMKKTAF